MHDDTDLRILQDRPEDLRGVRGEWIEEEGVLGSGELHQTELVGVPMESCRLTVEGDLRLIPDASGCVF
jgi:hypothetical protein